MPSSLDNKHIREEVEQIFSDIFYIFIGSNDNYCTLFEKYTEYFKLSDDIDQTKWELLFFDLCIELNYLSRQTFNIELEISDYFFDQINDYQKRVFYNLFECVDVDDVYMEQQIPKKYRFIYQSYGDFYIQNFIYNDIKINRISSSFQSINTVNFMNGIISYLDDINYDYKDIDNIKLLYYLLSQQICTYYDTWKNSSINEWYYQLILYIQDIIAILKIDKDTFKYNDIIHFTTFDTFKQILLSESIHTKDGKVKFDNQNNGDITIRAYNSSYMNDPKEGDILYSYLKDNLQNDLFDKECQELWKNNFAYIASFSCGGIKNLPLWNHYADNNNGIGIVIEHSFKNDFFEKYNIPIYSVVYMDEQYNMYSDFLDQKHIEKISFLLKQISDIFKENIDNSVMEIIFWLFNHIKYLFKSDVYRYECECRLLSFDDKNIYVDPNMKLYSEHRMKIKKVLFGSNVSSINKDIIIEYLKAVNNQIKCEENNIHFR